MKVKYNYDAEKNVIYTFPEGILSISIISEHFKTLLNDSKIKSGFVEIIDFRGIENFSFSYKEAVHLPVIIDEIKEQYLGAIFIAQSDLHIGMTRMCASILSKDLEIQIAGSDREAEDICRKLRETKTSKTK